MDSFFSRPHFEDKIGDGKRVSTIWVPDSRSYETCVFEEGKGSNVVWFGEECAYDDLDQISIARKAHAEAIAAEVSASVSVSAKVQEPSWGEVEFADNERDGKDGEVEEELVRRITDAVKKALCVSSRQEPSQRRQEPSQRRQEPKEPSKWTIDSRQPAVLVELNGVRTQCECNGKPVFIAPHMANQARNFVGKTCIEVTCPECDATIMRIVRCRQTGCSKGRMVPPGYHFGFCPEHNKHN